MSLFNLKIHEDSIKKEGDLKKLTKEIYDEDYYFIMFGCDGHTSG